MPTYRSPGVYLEPVFLKPEARLATGVPGFIGFANGTPNQPMSLHRKDEFLFATPPDAFLAEAVTGFFDNGGTRCYVALVETGPSVDPIAAFAKAIESLGPLTDLDLVAVPDAMALDDDARGGQGRGPDAMRPDDNASVEQVQRAAIEHCAKHGDRLAILDAHPAATPAQVLEHR